MPFVLLGAGGALNAVLIEDPGLYWVLLVVIAVAFGITLRRVGQRAMRRQRRDETDGPGDPNLS